TYDRNNAWNKDRVLVDSLIQNDKRFIRLGFIPVEDIVQLYNSASVVIMPSFYEGFGLPVLEAMQCGCPVITTRRGSLPEVVGDPAYIVNPDNITDIVKGITDVMNNKKLQGRLSKSGLEQAKKFSLAKTIKQTVEAYSSFKKALP